MDINNPIAIHFCNYPDDHMQPLSFAATDILTSSAFSNQIFIKNNVTEYTVGGDIASNLLNVFWLIIWISSYITCVFRLGKKKLGNWIRETFEIFFSSFKRLIFLL